MCCKAASHSDMTNIAVHRRSGEFLRSSALFMDWDNIYCLHKRSAEIHSYIIIMHMEGSLQCHSASECHVLKSLCKQFLSSSSFVRSLCECMICRNKHFIVICRAPMCAGKPLLIQLLRNLQKYRCLGGGAILRAQEGRQLGLGLWNQGGLEGLVRFCVLSLWCRSCYTGHSIHSQILPLVHDQDKQHDSHLH